MHEEKKKNITIFSVNFYPEDTAIGLYTTQMAEYLQKNGFEVSVITGFPYYPQWKIRTPYKDRPSYWKEDYKGIKIYRYKQYTPSKPTFLKRIVHIISFTLGNLRNLKKIKDADVVIAVIPFTANAWLAWKLAKKTGAKVWVHIQDFEFDAAFETGLIGNGLLGKLISDILSEFEKKLLNKADVLSTISYSMMEKARKKVGREVVYFPNWIDADFIDPGKAKQHPYLNSIKFKILYAGNIGAKQDWEKFIGVAEKFNDRDDVEFIVVGDGAQKNYLLQNTEHLDHVKIYPPVPYEALPDLLCSADLHILFQKLGVIDTVMPSKLLGMMASAKPSLVTGNTQSEVAKILKESGGGEFLSNDKGMHEIVEFIEDLIHNRHLIAEYGSRARKYIVEKFSYDKVLEKFHKEIMKILK